MKYKKFSIESIFEIKKVYGKPYKEYKKGNIPYVTGTQDNNGVVGYVSAPITAISKGNCISVDPIKGFACYQPFDFVGRGFSGASINLLYNEKINEHNALYLCAAIEKNSKKVAAYTNLFNSNRLSSALIVLPIKEKIEDTDEYTVNDIDWDYMESYILQLEAERISQLEAYLTVTGLNDYELTDEDKQILSLSTESAFNKDRNNETSFENEVRFAEFKIGDLFVSQTGDVDLQQKDINNKGYYFINSGYENQGIKGKTDKESKIFPSNTITIDMFGYVYYRDFKYKMATHNHVFSLSSEVLKSREIGLYIVTCMKKFKDMFSYNNMCSWTKIKELEIKLPIKKQIKKIKEYTIEDIDFEYMEKYIRAIEKQTIVSVYEGKGRIIDKTKEIVNK